MKSSKFTDAQKAGISQATYYSWKKKYAEMKRMRELEEKNNRPKPIVADLSLDRAMLQDVINRKLSGLRASASWLVR